MENTHQLKNICVLPKSLTRTENSSSQFYSALVHELRNPLTNIILSIDELTANLGKVNDEAKMYLDIIVRGAGRINKLVDMVLRLNASEVIHREEYSIHQLLEEVLEISEDRIRLKHIAVNRDYETQDCKALMNAQEMKIALTNIIINALEAMAMNSGQLNLVTRSIADKFLIQIEDNGCGISEENLKKIFKPYFTSKPGGLGIGLTSTCNILQSNHVGVNVKSELGKGTCFNLLLDKSYQ